MPNGHGAVGIHFLLDRRVAADIADRSALVFKGRLVVHKTAKHIAAVAVGAVGLVEQLIFQPLQLGRQRIAVVVAFGAAGADDQRFHIGDSAGHPGQHSLFHRHALTGKGPRQGILGVFRL
ncbi:hypothetical protein D3C72_1659900 [compost metagenome]